MTAVKTKKNAEFVLEEVSLGGMDCLADAVGFVVDMDGFEGASDMLAFLRESGESIADDVSEAISVIHSFRAESAWGCCSAN